MEPENPAPVPVASTNPEPSAEGNAVLSVSPEGGGNGGPAPAPRQLRWVFIGPQGLRAGWSVVLFLLLTLLLGAGMSWLAKLAHLNPGKGDFSPKIALIGEFLNVAVLVVAAWIVSRIERRRLLDYNLRGPRKVFHFTT